jgi:hypothetical protein
MEMNMKAQELTYEIYFFYPKVWDLLNKTIKNKQLKEETCPIRIGTYKHEIIIYYHDKNFIVPFNMLYGLLVDFFDNYDVFISVSYEYDGITEMEYFIGLIVSGNKEYNVEYGTRQEAQQQAILKACEILEGTL